MLMALDEVTQICPVPLPNWMADSAGKGILIVAVCHGLAQLEARWDSAGARAIWDTAGIKVILGGVADPDTLDRLSRLCGEIWLRMHSRSWYDDGRRARTATYQPVRVLPPELLRALPEWRALIIRGNLSPSWSDCGWLGGGWTTAMRSVSTWLIPLPPDDGSWHSQESGWEPDGSGELATQPRAHRVPRPRRPWEPPADPGGAK